MKRRLSASTALAAVVLSLANVGQAAAPGSSSIGPGNPSTSWTGQSYAAGATPGAGACAPSDAVCDHFTLNVGVKPSYWDTHSGGVTVSIGWGDAGDNFDLYVSDPGGLAASSASGASTSESAFIDNASGSYTVLVVPKQVINSGYNGSASFSSKAISTPATGTSGTGTSGGGGGGSGGGGGGGSGGGSGGGGKGGGGTSGGGSTTTSTSGSTGAGTLQATGTCAGCSFSGSVVSQEKIIYTYSLDRTSWYWSKQVDQSVELGPAAQRVRLPNPQSDDTLPVAVDNGDLDKVSALYLDLTSRGIQEGSQIIQFMLQIAETDNSSGEQPEFNTDGKQIQACSITDTWPQGSAETWDLRPPTSKSGCVAGKRTGSGGSQSWTFDLKSIAAPWGQDPFGKNFGVMLLPVVPKDAGPDHQKWQINLKIPKKDDPGTPANEYNQTKTRVLATVAWTGPVIQPTGQTGTSTTTTPTGTSSSGGTQTFDSGPAYSTISGGVSPTFGTSGGTSTGAAPAGATSSPVPQPVTPVAEIPGAKLPGIVWALLPIGILLIYALRSALLEPVGMRTEGVIAAIRRRNAAARGETVEEPGDVLTQARDATKRAKTLIRRSLRRK